MKTKRISIELNQYEYTELMEALFRIEMDTRERAGRIRDEGKRKRALDSASWLEGLQGKIRTSW